MENVVQRSMGEGLRSVKEGLSAEGSVFEDRGVLPVLQVGEETGHLLRVPGGRRGKTPSDFPRGGEQKQMGENVLRGRERLPGGEDARSGSREKGLRIRGPFLINRGISEKKNYVIW